VKNLLLILLVLAGVGLYFHDRQQTADLLKAQQDSDVLRQQLSDKDAALTTLQAQVRQYSGQYSQPSPAGGGLLAHPGGLNSRTGSGSWNGDPDSLSRPAYK
jgi:hypothetical protein